ncbi:MAG TPA: 2-dehydropantoate 2-reductase [Steroidobacteraceae bacterium]
MRSGTNQYDFAVLGAGAIGTILGAHLARAGHSVAMLARGHRAQQIGAEGLRITGLSNFRVPVHVLGDPAQLHTAGALIVAMKTPGTAEALGRLQHVATDVAFSIQNGPLKNELLVGAFGASRVLGCLADTSGEVQSSGEVAFTRNVNVLLGELSGEAGDRPRRIAQTLDEAGVRALAVTNIGSLEWSKFAAWVGLFALSITTRTVTWRYLTDRGAALVLVRLVREIGLLASRLGIILSDQAILPVATLCQGTEQDAVNTVMKAGEAFALNAPEHRMSSLQDLEAGRPLELHETLGYALEKASTLELSLPLVEAFYSVISAAERIRSAATLR